MLPLKLFQVLISIGLMITCNTALGGNFKASETPWDPESYHYIIVGGGTAGCVLAARLSEDKRKDVLLIEVGPDDDLVRATEIPFGLVQMFNSDIDWKFKSEPQQYNAGKALVNNTVIFHQGRVLGGTSSTNGVEYIRGNPLDFDAWAAAGNTGWSYKDVLPYFIKSERNQNPEHVMQGFHGFAGPWPIKDNLILPELTAKFFQAGKIMGYDQRDLNGPVQEGFMHVQNVEFLGKRMSTARAFLKPIMGRRNLKVITLAMVTKILIEKKKAKGVMYMDVSKGPGVPPTPHFVRAKKEVIISAGVFNSPKLLMLSGVGPETHLQQLGIPAIVDIPGVGSSLTDNVMTDISYIFNESITYSIEKYFNPLSLAEYMFQGTGFWSAHPDTDTAFVNPEATQGSGKHPLSQLKLLGFLFGNANGETGRAINNFKADTWNVLHGHELGLPGITVFVVLNEPRHKGTVRLRSPNPFADPAITLNYYKDPEDVKDMIKGIRFALKLLNTAPFQASGARLSVPHHPNCTEETFDTDAYWECYIRHNTLSEYHYSSSCRMGPDSDPDAVVDTELRVRGIRNLRVIDASVFPTGISGTMANTVMFAEKGADLIRGIVSV